MDFDPFLSKRRQNWPALKVAFAKMALEKNCVDVQKLNGIITVIKDEANYFMANAQVKLLRSCGRTPQTYAEDCKGLENLPPVISLTTIASRARNIKTIVKALNSQNFHSINLFISPDKYLLDDGIGKHDRFFNNLKLEKTNIYYCANIGPYRKFMPLINLLRKNGAPTDTPVITIDDDTFYPQTFLKGLLDILNKEEAVVAYRGRYMKGEVYDNFGLPQKEKSIFNLPTGRSGVAYRLKYFPACSDYYVGPIIAPTADDLWLKWALNMPALIINREACQDPASDFLSINPDQNSLFSVYNRQKAAGLSTNDQTMRLLDLYFKAANLQNAGSGGFKL